MHVLITTIPTSCHAKLVPLAVLGRPVFRAIYHNCLLHACFTAAGQGATAIVNGDEVVGAAALDANADEHADLNASLSVQSQGKVTS